MRTREEVGPRLRLGEGMTWMSLPKTVQKSDKNMTTISTNVEASTEAAQQQDLTPAQKKQNWLLLVLYCALVTLGGVGGPLLQRLYFIHGGTLKWFQSALPAVGFFILLPPLFFNYFKTKLSTKLFFLDFKLFYWGVIIGILLGLSNYMGSVGMSRLPVSTTSLLSSTNLVFVALFSFIIVKQKFTFYSTNAVIVITLGAVVLALHSSSDRPPGITSAKYFVGFLLTLGGVALSGLTAPLYQLSFTKTSRTIDYLITMQVVIVVNLSSSMFAVIGMLVNKEFQAIPKEAKEFSLGEANYLLIAIASAIIWQLSFIGVAGIVSCKSSLFAGVFGSGLIPITQVAAVITFHEKFTGEKALSLTLCLWGFTSYFLGEFKMSKKVQKDIENKVETGGNIESRTDLEFPKQNDEYGDKDKVQDV